MNLRLPLVSVILPVCNEVEYFDDALDSILNQTYKNIEVLVIDGSDDLELIPCRLPYDVRILYFYREKNGISDALNFGLKQASGEYIARMDADDLSTPERFEKQVSFLVKNKDIDVVGTWFSIIKEDGTLISEERVPESHAKIAAKMIFENPICHPSVMIRRSVFDDVSYPKTTAEDYALWTSMIPKYRFANISEILFKWRRYGNANTNVMINKVCISDTISAADYVRSLFGVELSYYEFSESLLIKKYFKEKLRDCYKSDGVDFVLSEYRLLNELNRKCPIWMKQDLVNVLHDRWKYVLGLIGDYTKDYKELMNLSFKQNAYTKYNKLEFIKKVLEENELARIDMLMRPLNVVLYGMGKEGVEALEKYSYAVQHGKTAWHVSALVDGKVQSIKVDDKDYEVFSPKIIRSINPDLIVITSSVYYEEIKGSLEKIGFDQRIIKSPAALYYT